MLNTKALTLNYNPVEDEHENIVFKDVNYNYRGDEYEYLSVYRP
jgi:hypothetical protein